MGQENKSFPSNKLEALALLYVEKSEDVSSLSPKTLLKRYNSAYDELRRADVEKKPNPMGYFQ
nr:MAG TPA: hypothetical protein [Caudoviricetes sp.]